MVAAGHRARDFHSSGRASEHYYCCNFCNRNNVW
jgi:hypothetical protein